MPEDHQSISILGWPPNTTRSQGAAILVEALGLDPFTADMRVAKAPPMIVARVAATVAPSVVQVLKSHKVPTFVLSDEDLSRLPAPILAKRLEPAIGAPRPMYMVEPWRGDPVGLLMDDVYCIVRGRVGLATVGPAEVEVTPKTTPYGWGLGPGWSVDVNVTHKRTSRISDVIDLWLYDREHARMGAGGRILYGIKRIRINGDKFNWDVLGKSRGMSDGNNADQLAVILGGQAPHAAVEVGFAEFKDASAAAIGTGWTATFAGGSRKDDTGAFDFYSAWCGIMRWQQNAAKKQA
jgi:hypothetical protein